jgi:hypothetical protein
MSMAALPLPLPLLPPRWRQFIFHNRRGAAAAVYSL